MNALKTIVVAATLAVAGSAFAAGPFDALTQGMVGGDFKSTVRLDNVTVTNKAGLGAAQQSVNIGSVAGGKVFGKAELNVKAKEVYITNKAGLGYASQDVNIGSIK